MDPIKFNKKDIEKICVKAEAVLINKQNVLPIKYIDFDYKTFDANNKVILSSISKKTIVYCIWIGKSIDTFSPKYIGYAGSNYPQGRIRAHMTYQSNGTSAQLKNIQAALKAKMSIGLSFIVIDPEYMRKSLEEWLIVRNSDKYKLWNKGKF